jgi:integrase
MLMSETAKESVYHLSEEDIRKIILFAPSLRDRVVIKILANTGIRRGELRDIDIQNIEFDKRRLHVMHGKGDKQRSVPVDPDTLQDIKFFIGNRVSGRLITSSKQEGISLKQINEICTKCGQLAGVRHPNPAKSGITPHLFRHSFARKMLKKGMRMEEVQKILGHASIKTTIDVYGTPGMDSVQESYDKIMSGS